MTYYLPIPKGICILILFFFFGSSASAQLVANLEWVKTVGGAQTDYAHNVCTDQSGNIYTTGIFSGTVDFDPGSAVVNLTSAGTTLSNSDIFITKTSSDGNLIWAKSIGGAGADGGATVTVDNIGHLYVSGWFIDAVDFDAGVGVTTLTSTGTERNLFIMKLDTAANFKWAKRIGSAGYQNYQSLLIDPLAGHLVFTGSFGGSSILGGTADFGSLSLTSDAYRDYFIAKADTAGNFIWAKGFGGALIEQQLGNVSGIDPAGNIYVGSKYRGTIDFDAGIGIHELTSVGTLSDAFVVKYNAAGEFVWVKSFSGIGTNEVHSITVDPAGYVYCTGLYENTLDADPGTNVFNLTSIGATDVFIIKLDTAGNFVWAKSVGGIADDNNSGLALDYDHNVYIAGRYQFGIDINPGVGVDTLTGSLGFLLKLNSAGNYVWGINMPGSGYNNIALDNNDNIYVAYGFTGTQDFDPSPGLLNKTAVGSSDIYLTKLNQDCSTFDVLFENTCDSFTLNGQTYTASGNYTQTIANGNAQGCDSLIYINLTISHSFDSLITVSACGSYTFDGTIHSTSGTYVHTYTSSSSGCDSLMTINLTIFNNFQGDTLTATACNVFTFDGTEYSSSGIYTHPLTISTGCDSLVTLDITIQSTDISVMQSGVTLTANALGATYQWLDCNNNNTPIAGAQSRIFNSNVDGSYSVVVTKDGCSDTSICYTVTHGTGIGKLGMNNTFNLYPNPTGGFFTIDFSNKVNNASMYLFNAIGQQIKSVAAFSGNTTSFDLRTQASGIYYLKVAAQENTAWIKIVKQ